MPRFASSRGLAAAVLLAALPLGGCLSVSGRVGMASGLGDVAASLNAAHGTDFAGSTMTTGYGLGGEMYGVMGVQLARMTGTQTSPGTDGTSHTLRLTQADTEANFAYPVYHAGPLSLAPGLSLTHRRTTLQYSQKGTLVSGDDATALVLRPHLKAVTTVGDRAILSAGAGYEVAFLNDPVAVRGGASASSGTPGPQANVTLTVFFCSGCVR